jgi:SAM-dependent methyltransferase
VQTEDYASAEQLFSPDYAYFSSASSSWLTHARNFSRMIISRMGLNAKSFVIEIGCNDGYLLKNFIEVGIPCMGIEPTSSTASAARALRIPILQEFFSQAVGGRLSDSGQQADLIIANNVYAHVPDINDFTMGLKTLLKPGGTITLEFPHLMRLIEHTQFDTIYHEHFSYLSLYTVMNIFQKSSLRVFDVEELPTHGGSLRVYGCHAEDLRQTAGTISVLLCEENQTGLRGLEVYKNFQSKVDRTKDNFLMFLIGQKQRGKKVVAYGAAAKGNTLLNYAGVRPDLILYVCDAAPSKQGKFLPGSHIPIVPPSVLRVREPDVVLILPWNISAEIVQQHGYVREWGGTFMRALPEMEVLL